jgi:hypothetical protein
MHWDNDYPDCDWNFSARLQRLTSLQVDPGGKIIRLTDPELFDYPFIYNNDIGDGWEREGEDKEYFRLYSERVSYPIGINIVMYAMTH